MGYWLLSCFAAYGDETSTLGTAHVRQCGMNDMECCIKILAQHECPCIFIGGVQRGSANESSDYVRHDVDSAVQFDHTVDQTLYRGCIRKIGSNGRKVFSGKVALLNAARCSNHHVSVSQKATCDKAAQPTLGARNNNNPVTHRILRHSSRP